MEKILEIDLMNNDDLFDKYNKKNICKELLDYMIESTPRFRKDDKLKIIIYNGIDKECVPFIMDGLKKEYEKSISRHYRNNWVQLIYLVAGVLLLFFSTLIEKTLFKEIVLIGGWVFIWAMVELEIFTDINGRKKRRILKRLLNSEVIEIKVKKSL